MAQKGYIVLSYSTRGFGKSGGYVTLAGPRDIEDLSVAISWLQQNTPVDAKNIAAGGLSYGSGIALLGLMHEPRLKTIFAGSPFPSVLNSLYQGETFHNVWWFAAGLGELTGRLDQDFYDVLKYLNTGQNLTFAYDWLIDRSLLSYIGHAQMKHKPILLMHNFGDHLLWPNDTMNLYHKLTVPKMLIVYQGGHCLNEAIGVISYDSEAWKLIDQWIEHWLKGKPNGIEASPPVRIQVAGRKHWELLESWPPPSFQEKKYYLTAPRLFHDGGLQLAPNEEKNTAHIHSAILTTAKTELLFVADFKEAILNFPEILWLPSVHRGGGLVFQGEPLAQSFPIRGSATLQLQVSSSSGKALLVGYLYDVDSLGKAVLITHGASALREGLKDHVYQRTLVMRSAAYDLPPGHHLAIVVDTQDILFAPPTSVPYRLTFHFDPLRPSLITLPQY
jgi:predicted acyl esterase